MKLENKEEDFSLIIDDDEDSNSSCASSPFKLCRICHEEEEESSTGMESPCACSGSLKFAHRGCIQRWCNEKGSSICEICLQKFEPGYTVHPKSALLDIDVTIRGSLEATSLNYESEDTELIAEESDTEYPECSPPSNRTTTFRSLALIFMVLLLCKHLIDVIMTGEGHYPFALITVIFLRAVGILLPLYLILRIVSAVQKRQWQHQRRLQINRRDASVTQRGEHEESQQHRIQIQPWPASR